MIGVINRIKLKGFRGSKRSLELVLNASAILMGSSGSGKTTLLQAIEWGLFGKILGFSGYGFTDEDAYVNMFSDDSEAFVELDLSLPDGKNLIVQRNRQAAAKSTVGKTKLEVRINGQVHSGKEAQNLIEELIGLNHEKFAQAVFLHQDMIRKFIEGGPKDRSEIIDQLLGLNNLREFTEALDPKRKIKNEIKILEETKQGLEEQQTSIEIDTQERLNERRKELIDLGFNENELRIEYVDGQINSLITQLNSLSEKYGKNVTLTNETFTNAKRAKEALGKLETTEIDLDRARVGRKNELQTEQIHIQELVNQYKQSKSKAIDRTTEELAIEISDIIKQNPILQNQRNGLIQKIDKIDPILRDNKHLSGLHKAKINELKKVTDEFGVYAALEKRKGENLQEIKTRQEEISQEDSLTKIFTSAYSYISKTGSKNCPLCKQDIDPETLLRELDEQNKATGASLLQNQQTIDKLIKENRQIDSSLFKIGKIQEEIAGLKSNVAENMRELREVTSIDDISDEKAAVLVESFLKEIKEIENTIQANELQKNILEREKQEIEATLSEINTLEENLKNALPAPVNFAILEEQVISYLNELERKIQDLNKTAPIDSTRNSRERIEAVVDYILSLEEFERKIGEKSVIDKRIEKIEQKILKLDDLETSLQVLREAVSEHKSELTEKSIDEFQESIDCYYNKIIGHPFFKKLKIKPNLGEQVTYDILAYDETGELETHINTRFSTAQANATALALFFAINQKLVADFSLLILDDPTQNMDPTYQTALAETLGSLSQNRQLLIATHETQFANKLLEKLPSVTYLIKMKEWTTDGVNPAKNIKE